MSSITMARYRMRALIAASSIGLLIGASAGAAYLGGRLAKDSTDRHQAARLMQMAEANNGDFTPSAALGVRPLNSTALTIATRFAPYGGAAQPNAQAAQALSDLRTSDDVRQQKAPVLQASLETTVAAPAVRAAAAMVFKGHSQTDSDCLTQAVYYEARGEGAEGMRAVAQVILNRVRHPAFPKTICGVVYQGGFQRTGCQFSFVCNGAMGGPVEGWAWRRAKDVASSALNGYVMKAVGTATHFHTLSVDPRWAGNMVQVTTVGSHIFYQFRGRGARINNDTDGVSPSGAIPNVMQANIVTPADAAAQMNPAGSPTTAAAQTPAAPVDAARSAQLVTALSRLEDAPRAIPMAAKITGKPAEEVAAALTQTTPAQPAPAPVQPVAAPAPAKPAIAPILLARPLH